MRVFYFINKKWGIDNIRNSRLKISRITELNDPFELLNTDLSEEGYDEHFKALKIEISKVIGILCFSHCWSNPVQWSHYAENHKGLCLGFEIQQKGALEVTYIEKRYDREFTKRILTNRCLDENKDLLTWITSKYNHWVYENEFRCILKLENKTPDSEGHVYKCFDEELKLVEIIIGAKSDISHEDIKLALGNNLKDIQIFKAKPSLTSFEIERNIL